MEKEKGSSLLDISISSPAKETILYVVGGEANIAVLFYVDSPTQ